MREYTVREYDMEDYDIQRDQIDEMSNQELADSIRGIARGWLPDYNFTGDESDFNNSFFDFNNMSSSNFIFSISLNDKERKSIKILASSFVLIIGRTDF